MSSTPAAGTPGSAGTMLASSSAGRSTPSAAGLSGGATAATAGSSAAAGTAATTAGSSGAGASGSGGLPPTAAGSGAPALPMTPAADPGAPMPSPGCMSGSLKPGRTTGSIQSSGGNRTFIRYVPTGYDGKKPLPLVVDLHPFSVDASYSESSSGFRQLADMEGYIYLAPNGMSGMWDSVGDTDEKFIRDLVEDTAAKGCVDARRVYATGCSNGGAFSFLLMCTAEDIFAAVAPMCGTAFFDIDSMCMLDRPVSIMVRIGLQDTLNCWEGEGMVLDAPNVPMGTRVPCAKTVQKILSEKYHCTGAIKMEAECEVVGDCDQGTEIAICGERTGHVVYSSSTARDTWAFLKQFYKP
jgi:polyhydroxybutyrate depolymerase